MMPRERLGEGPPKQEDTAQTHPAGSEVPLDTAGTKPHEGPPMMPRERLGEGPPEQEDTTPTHLAGSEVPLDTAGGATRHYTPTSVKGSTRHCAHLV